MLLFYVGENRYVIHNRYVIRILPHVFLKKISHASSYFIGVLNLAGKPIAVIDFCQLIDERPTKNFFHSRIILVKESAVQENPRIIGILAEKVLKIVDLEADEFTENQFYMQHLSYLDGIYNDESGVIQLVNVNGLFKFLGEELFNVAKEPS